MHRCRWDRKEVERGMKSEQENVMKRLWREGRKGQVENCSLGSLKAAGPGLKLDPI